MRKNIFFPVALCAAMFASSCDNDVSKDEIASLLTEEVRCGLSGGIPITSSQAAKIKAVVEIINTKDWNEQVSTTQYPDLAGENLDSLVDFIKLARTKLNGGKLYYDNALMKSIYEYAYAKFAPGDETKQNYCACGYEFCDAGIACGEDNITHMAVCAANNTVDPALNLECNPVNVSPKSLVNVLMTHQMPLLEKLGDFRDFEARSKKSCYTFG